MLVSGIYALTAQTDTGLFSTGIVDIKINIYELNNENQEIMYESSNNDLLPGDIISFIPKISNSGSDCYVRIKIKYIDDTTDFTNYVTGFSNDFTKYGDFYYYNNVLGKDESIKVFDSIRIPEHVTSDSDKLKLEIIAEAVQEKNFQPDYSLSNPWKDIIPSKSINNSYNIDTNNKIIVNFENESNNDINIPNNFFDNFYNILPGDSFEDSIEIKNVSKTNSKYFMKFSTEGSNTNEIELLSRVSLLVKNKDNQTIYNGKLLSNENIILGEYNLNDYDKLYFEVSVPSYLGNEFAALTPKILLNFSSDYNKETSDNQDSSNESSPKTGDSIDFFTIIFLTSSFFFIIIMFLWYKESNKEEN